jgi:hypothetical protein
MIYLSPTTLNVKNFNAEQPKEVIGGSSQIKQTSTTFDRLSRQDRNAIGLLKRLPSASALDIGKSVCENTTTDKHKAVIGLNIAVGLVRRGLAQATPGNRFIATSEARDIRSDLIVENKMPRSSRQQRRMRKRRPRLQPLYAAAHKTLWSARAEAKSVLIQRELQ